MNLAVSEIAIDNALLKLKIIEYQKEYLNKKNIANPSTEELTSMRKAVALRLKKDLKEISKKHLEITNRIYEDYY